MGSEFIKKLLVIVGPTAVGKSKIGIELASQINGEIISGDSMQIYKKMDIGTAKIKPEQRIASNGNLIPHHMIDIIEPTEDYSVAQFQSNARKCIENINKQGKFPILLGGTGLYIRSIIDDYNFYDINNNFREELLELSIKSGNKSLYSKLSEVDPKSASKFHPNDTKRIIRALEFYYSEQKPLSDEHKAVYTSIYNPLFMYGLSISREQLYDKINKRVDNMIADGWVEEVQGLLECGVQKNNTALQAIGYKHIVKYLKNDYSLTETVRLIKRDTRRFAKRQFTWFKKDPRIKWFNYDNPTQAKSIIGEIKEDLSRNKLI